MKWLVGTLQKFEERTSVNPEVHPPRFKRYYVRSFILWHFVDTREGQWKLFADFRFHFAPCLPHFFFLGLDLVYCRNMPLRNLVMVHLAILQRFIVDILKVVVLGAHMLGYESTLCYIGVFIVVVGLVHFSREATCVLIVNCQFRMRIQFSHERGWKRRLSFRRLRDG